MPFMNNIYLLPNRVYAVQRPFPIQSLNIRRTHSALRKTVKSMYIVGTLYFS